MKKILLFLAILITGYELRAQSVPQGLAFEIAGDKSVTIPSSVISIGNAAFLNCGSLTSITLSQGTQVGNDVFPDTARIIYRD